MDIVEDVENKKNDEEEKNQKGNDNKTQENNQRSKDKKEESQEVSVDAGVPEIENYINEMDEDSETLEIEDPSKMRFFARWPCIGDKVSV